MIKMERIARQKLSTPNPFSRRAKEGKKNDSFSFLTCLLGKRLKNH